MKYAVIDISSTGVSLLIAEGDKQLGIFSAIYKYCESIAVADYIEKHAISQRGVDILIEALKGMRLICKDKKVEECYCISTAAFRNVRNIEEIAKEIKSVTGLTINYLDGTTEAYCDYLSNRNYSVEQGRAVLIDIGGGSVEICDLQKNKKEDMGCLEFGPIKLCSKFNVDIYPTDEQDKEIKKYVRKKLDDNNIPQKHEFNCVVLVGSINESIYRTYMEFCKNEKLEKEFEYEKFKLFCRWLKTSPDRTRVIMEVAPEKINMLPTAAVLLKTLLKRFKPSKVLLSSNGVKEGYLALIKEEEQSPVDLSVDIVRSVGEPPKKNKKSAKSEKKEEVVVKLADGDKSEKEELKAEIKKEKKD